jgi:hypothetical protein
MSAGVIVNEASIHSSGISRARGADAWWFWFRKSQHESRIIDIPGTCTPVGGYVFVRCDSIADARSLVELMRERGVPAAAARATQSRTFKRSTTVDGQRVQFDYEIPA